MQSAPGSLEMLSAYYGILTTLDQIPDSEDVQLNYAMEALEKYPIDAQLLCALGGYLQNKEHLDLACRAYETAFQHGQVHPQVWHLIDIEEVATICYVLVFAAPK